MIVAKSNNGNNISLEEHSKEVSDKAVKELKKLPNVKEHLMVNIKVASLLHDIGKSTDSFQKHINGEKVDKKHKNKYLHQQVSWAFVDTYFDYVNYFKDNEIKNCVGKNIIPNLIYWHHGILDNEGICAKDVLGSIPSSDIDTMKKELGKLIDSKYIINNPKKNNNTRPDYFLFNKDRKEKTDNLNRDITLIRMILVYSDRTISGADDINLKKANKFLFEVCHFPDDKRFKEQKKIINDIKDEDKTTIIKAPTGFGKTMLGLMWSEKSDKKLLWVCPRNNIAISTYYSIVKELEDSEKKVNIELRYAGKVQKSSFNGEGKEADIIITNIDYYLRPYSNAGKDMSLMYFIIHSDVIFDEYHENVTDLPIFSLFINLMRVRNIKTDSRTLLLSATPIDISHLWTTNSNKTKIIPNGKNHLPSIHKKEYKVNIINKIPSTISNDEILFVNSIKESQEIAKELTDAILIHSNFIEGDKLKMFDKLLKDYGKDSKTTNRKPYISTLILQAALDISFNNLYEIPLSPESTLQRIGRCNRWGRNKTATINIIDTCPTTSNGYVVDIKYNESLRKLWVDHLKLLSGSSLTLDEIYVHYNDFNITNNTEIVDYIDDSLHQSNESSSNNIYPVKHYNTTPPSYMSANSNPLRSNGSEVFFIVQDVKGKWVGPFTKSMYDSFDKDFNEGGTAISVGKMIKIIKNISSPTSGYKYNYGINSNKHYKNIKIDDLRRKARLDKSPYIAINFSYDYRLGIIKKII